MSSVAVLRFHGVRGSIPVPGPATARVGGNTPCVSVEIPGAPLLILDAGTGIRSVPGLDSVADLGIELFLTHTHWDHIQGLPFFQPLYEADGNLRISGPRHPAGLRQVLERLAHSENFPIPPSRWRGLLDVRELDESPVAAGPVTVRPVRLCHPGPTLGYRLEVAGIRPIAYLTDNELAGGVHGVTPGWRPGLVDFLAGCDVLIHDTTWEDGEVARHTGWGHSSPSQAVALATEAGCRRLVLFHHHPDHGDVRLEERCREAQELAATQGGVAVELAREGATLALDLEA